jgi:SAM-dependent methyltransferase
MNANAAGQLDEKDLRVRLGAAVSRAFSIDLERAYDHVDRLCLQLCFRVANACSLLSDRTESLDEIASRASVATDAKYLVGAVLDILSEEGFAQRTDEGYRRVRQCPGDEAALLQSEARAACPDASPILEMIERCHEHALDFVAGRKSGFAVAFALGDLALWERLHSVDRVMSIYADLVPPALEAIARPGMRVLEVGGGVGAVLQRCLPLLGPRGIERYSFTDIGQSFVHGAQRRFSGNACIDFSRINIDAPLHAQIVDREGYDVVIAVNVLHVAKRLSFSLAELHAILNPRGYLLLSEGSPPDRSRRWRLDVVFAFLRGWWDVAVEQPWRRTPGFLLPSEWTRALAEVGFDPIQSMPGENYFDASCRGGVILARKRPRSPQP